MAGLKNEHGEFLSAATKMRSRIDEAHDNLMIIADLAQENAYRCYNVDLPGHEPYTKILRSLAQECKKSAEKLENFAQSVEQYLEYLDQSLWCEEFPIYD